MFEEAKAIIQRAIDQNDALIAVDAVSEEKTAPAWARNSFIRRVLAVVLAVGICLAPLVTAFAHPGGVGVYLLVVVAVLALARSAARAVSVSPIGAAHLVVLASLTFIAVLVALGMQADINLQAGITATGGILLAVVIGAIATPTLIRMWRTEESSTT
jgi:cellobiose-specific phosphotransferase system component IIC